MKNTSNPWIWSLYDFANSFASIIVAFYFSLFVVGSLGKSDIWVSAPVAIATLLLLLTLPFYGSVADRMKRYKPALFATTLISIAALFLMGIFSSGASRSPAFFVGIIICYFLFQYFYQAALSFYLTFLQHLSKTYSREFTASLGLAAGQLGNVVGILIAFPIASSDIPVFGISGPPLAFCLGAILFLIFFLPFHFKFQESAATPTAFENFLPRSFRELVTQFRDLKREKNILRYLIAYYLFADAILTLQLFASLYLEKVGLFEKGMQTGTFAFGLLTAIIGAMLTPWFHRKIGNTKRAVGIMIIVWSILLLGLALAQTNTQMIVTVILNGFAFGSLFSLSRIMYSKLIPQDQSGKYFGFYVLFEKFASILGPLLWSLSAWLFVSAGDNRYRFAIGSLAILVLVSYFVLKGVKEDYRS